MIISEGPTALVVLRKGPLDGYLHGVPPSLLPFHTLGLDPQHPSLIILPQSQYWSFCGLPSLLQMEGVFLKQYVFNKEDPWLLRLLTEDGFPGGSNSKEFACNAGDPGLISGSGRSPEGNGSPLRYSCLENSMDRRSWQATVHRVTEIGHD